MSLQQAFTGNAALVMMIALGAIGALVIVGEYGTCTIRTTFAAVPARHTAMGAKVVVVTVVTTVFGGWVAVWTPVPALLAVVCVRRRDQ